MSSATLVKKGEMLVEKNKAVDLAGRGAKNGLMIICDSPTLKDYEQNRIIAQQMGAIVTGVLNGCKNSLPIYLTAAYKLGMPLGKNPTKKEWSSYVPKLQEEILAVNPQKILLLGPIALSTALGAPKLLPITKWRGKGFELLGHYTLATYSPWAIDRDPDLFRDFSNDIQKLCKYSQTIPPINPRTIIARKEDHVKNGLEELQRFSTISCDLETTGLDFKTNKIESIGFGALDKGGKQFALIIPRDLVHEAGTKERLKAFFWQYKGKIVFHNAKFDVKFLLEYFQVLSLPCLMADTMLMHYASDERPMGRYSIHGLKDLSRFWFDAEDYAVNFDAFYALPEQERDYEALYRYHAKDVVYTIQLYNELYRELSEESPKLHRLHDDLLMPSTKAFAEIEREGVWVDQDYLTVKSIEFQILQREAQANLDQLVGEHINALSPTEVQHLLYETLGLHVREDKNRWGHDDNDSTRKTDLLDLAFKLPADKVQYRPVIEAIVNIRNYNKLRNTYFEGLLEKAKHDGKVHTEIRLAGTATGRLASAEPNLQNIPARVGSLVRRAFVAAPGNTFVQCDFAQLELRVLAWLCKDPVMADTFRRGEDIHRVVAAEIFHKPPESVTKNERFLAKSIDFGIVYGRTAQALVTGVEMDIYEKSGGKRLTVSEAQGFIDKFLGGFPNMKEWMDRTKYEALVNQYSETEFGRRRRYPLILKNSGFTNTIGRQAINTPIQSMASDLCLSALVRLHSAFKSKNIRAKICFPVHDSILFEVHLDDVDLAKKLIREQMEHCPGIEDRGVPFSVTCEIGATWGTMEETNW